MSLATFIGDAWQRRRRRAEVRSAIASPVPESREGFVQAVDRLHSLAHSLPEGTPERDQALIKAQDLFSRRFDEDIAKAQTLSRDSEERKSLLWDPLDLLMAMDYRERPSAMGYGTLAQMAMAPPIAAIIQLRTHQAASFCEPWPDRHDLGFEIALRDKGKTMTRAQKKRAHELADIVLGCGLDYGSDPDRDDFTTFIKKVTRDSLRFDQLNFEIQQTRGRKPYALWAVDASTIRVVDQYRYGGNPEAPRYIQIYQDTPWDEFRADEMAFGVRNPRAGLKVYGYGFSELEQMVSIVTNYLFGIQYNQAMFTRGTAAHTLLNIKSPVPQRQLKEFRLRWQAMVSGVTNAFRLPITNFKDGVEAINLQTNPKDLEMSAFLDFCLKLMAAIMLIDPVELNFSYGNAGQGSQVFASPVSEKITKSKDRGLAPLMRFLARMLNEHLVQPIEPEFRLVWKGIKESSAAQEADLLGKAPKMGWTVNEVRAFQDLGPDKNGLGDMVMDPTYVQLLNAKMQQDQMAQMQQGQDQGFQSDQGSGGGGYDPQGNDFDHDAFDDSLDASLQAYQ